MSPSARKRWEHERREREREAEEEAARTRLKRLAERRSIAAWNALLMAGWRNVFYPTVGAALRSGCPWLHVVCPACGQLGEADLRTLDIHPNASIAAVVRAMSCQRCSPHPPFARPLGATRRSWYGRDGWIRPRRYAGKLTIPDEPCADDIGWAQRQVARQQKRTKG
jgi:hypothetical protein